MQPVDLEHILAGLAYRHSSVQHGPGKKCQTNSIKYIINNYWARSSKILWFVSGEHINNYLLKPKVEANNYWSARHWQITIFNNYYFLKSRWIVAENLESRKVARVNILPLSLRLKRIIVLNSIYSLSDLNNIFCGLYCVSWYSIFLDFRYFTNANETWVYTGHFVLFGTRIIHSVGSE